MSTTTHHGMTGTMSEEALPVRSRINWGAIIAGAAVALAVYVLLSLFGLAIGLSVGEQVGAPTAIWMIISSLIALFVGGWVCSQCTIGENRMEAALYGLILWGVLFAFLVWLAGVGVQIGLNTMLAAGQEPVMVAPAEPAPGAEQPAAQDATATAWWAFTGTLVSMLAAVAGSITGSGTYLGRRATGAPATTTSPGIHRPAT